MQIHLNLTHTHTHTHTHTRTLTGHAQLPPDILLDLNAFDNTTLDYTNEYKDLDTPVFLSDPNNTNMTLFSTMRSVSHTAYIYCMTAV